MDQLEKKLKSLHKQHADLDKKVTKMETTGVYEDSHLEKMKKQRLHIKDNIAKIQAKQQFSESKK